VVDLNKDSFIGREALVAQKSKGTLPKRLVQFLLQDPEPLLRGLEPILCDGAYCGYIRAGLSATRWAPQSASASSNWTSASPQTFCAVDVSKSRSMTSG